MKPTKPDTQVQVLLNNLVVITSGRVREAKRPFLREYAKALLDPALDAMSEEAFTLDEFHAILTSLMLILEAKRTGNYKLAPAIGQAKELTKE